MKVDGVVGLLAKAALLPGEDPKKYDALFDEIGRPSHRMTFSSSSGWSILQVRLGRAHAIAS